MTGMGQEGNRKERKDDRKGKGRRQEGDRRETVREGRRTGSGQEGNRKGRKDDRKGIGRGKENRQTHRLLNFNVCALLNFFR